MKSFIRYFFNGLLFIIPFGITAYVIYIIVKGIDNIVPSLFGLDLFPGVGLVIFMGFTVIIGYMGSTLIAKPAFSMVENYLYKLPIINLIYSSSKDVINAFIGEKKKFNQPVLVKINKEMNIHRLGFITQSDLSVIHIHDKAAVYFPHSYNISGNLVIVPIENITVIQAPSSEIMKFIVSGGVTGLAFKDSDIITLEKPVKGI
jgi:uncharacterized membrane protein